jgi:signal transduction histidine kinase
MRGDLREPVGRVIAPVTIAVTVGLLPGRTAAFVAAALTVLAIADLVTRLVQGRSRPRAVHVVAFSAAAAVLGTCAVEVAPLRSAPGALAAAAEDVESRWRALLADLDSAVSDVPPPGSDYGWIEARVGKLGAGSGLSVLSADAAAVLAWGGWTTVLREDERRALLESLGADPAILVLRRGLTLRVLFAKHGGESVERGGEVVLAEVPLAEEPDAGWLSGGIGPGIEARVRWETVGEGVRAEVGAFDIEGAAGEGLWSLVPLMGEETEVAGRVSLAVLPDEAARERQTSRRRAVVALVAAAGAACLAFAGIAGAWAVGLARVIALLACDWLSVLSPLHSASAWPLEGSAGAWPFSLLWHTPVDAALTGLGLAAMAGLASRPTRRRARVALGLVGAVGLLGSLLIVWQLTVRYGLAPGELLLPPFDSLPTRATTVLALASPVWASLALLALGRGWARRRCVLVSAIAAGLIAGVCHGASLAEGARRVAEQRIASLVDARGDVWRDALLGTLEIAVPSRGGIPLTRDRDAIDLWWNSPLGRLGLASGVWKYDPGFAGEPSDAFVTGMPPIVPLPSLSVADPDFAGPFPRALLEPYREKLEFVEGAVELLAAEVQGPDGGVWLAAVLVEPGNLPGRAGDDPLRGSRTERESRPTMRPLGLEPRLAWFDESGALIGSDLDAGPPAPLAPPPAPRWREAESESRRAALLEIPDPSGTVTVVVLPPDALTLAALAIAWATVLAVLAALAIAAVALASAPRAATRSVEAFFARIVTHFRDQVAISFAMIGLLSLLVLAGTGRGTARRQAAQLLTNEGADKVHFARRLVESSLTLDPEGPLDEGPGLAANQVAAWMAAALGEDLAVWRSGTLLATSRFDLIRAGLWPERLPGELWDAVHPGRRPLAIDPLTASLPESGTMERAAHGPFRSPGGLAGVVSVSLGAAGERVEQELADIDRALLVSTALLIGLGVLLLVPLTRRMTAPLAELERATARVASGDFGAAVPDTGFEETRALARAFRAMTESLAMQRTSLERRRRAIETLIDSLPVAVVAYGGEGAIRASNPRARELLADAGSEAGDRGEGALVDAVREMRRSVGESARTVDLGAPGDEAPRRMRVSAIDVPGLTEGEPARLVVVEDLTDALRAERLTAWAEMARRIAHEIKNPLTPISLMVEHVRRLADRRDERLHEVLDECLRTIADQVSVLRDTSREFSDYARLLVPRPVELELGGELRRWLAPYAIAPAGRIELRFESSGEELRVRADPRLLRRAVINLVDNAIGVVRGGGRVTVSWDRDESGAARIEVQDSGPGIDPARLGSLFEPDVTTRETGSGLGLPIAREAVEALGGRLLVDPRPGRGARFTILLTDETD